MINYVCPLYINIVATFSTFSVDVANMVGRGEMNRALSYMMVNNVGGVVAAAAGMMAVRKLLKVKI